MPLKSFSLNFLIIQTPCLFAKNRKHSSESTTLFSKVESCWIVTLLKRTYPYTRFPNTFVHGFYSTTIAVENCYINWRYCQSQFGQKNSYGSVSLVKLNVTLVKLKCDSSKVEHRRVEAVQKWLVSFSQHLFFPYNHLTNVKYQVVVTILNLVTPIAPSLKKNKFYLEHTESQSPWEIDKHFGYTIVTNKRVTLLKGCGCRTKWSSW